MPSIIIKPRAGGKSAQLVRSVYSKTLKRSITVNVGSVSVTAEASKLPAGIRLVSGQTLCANDLEKVRKWLEVCGKYPYPPELVRKIEEDVETRMRENLAAEQSSSSPTPNEPDEPHTQLLSALRRYNQAALEIQTAYRRLPKGAVISDDTILEYQKTWFSNQDMMNTLKVKPCFYRSGGWSNLRNQVLGGMVYKEAGASSKRSEKED